MKISEMRKRCWGNVGEERNQKLCQSLNWIDEPFIYSLDREILNLRRDRSILQNIDDFLEHAEEIIINHGNMKFNSYPFGAEADEMYPRFLAICRGDSIKLNTVLDQIEEQSKKIAEIFQKTMKYEKTVILVTDKWDAGVFHRYEKQLLNYAVTNGIWYVFLLATDYGYTEIPFLPHTREILRNMQKGLGSQE